MIYGGYNFHHVHNDWIIFDMKIQRVVTRQYLKGMNEYDKVVVNSYFRQNNGSILFLTYGDETKFEVCKIKKGHKYI